MAGNKGPSDFVVFLYKIFVSASLRKDKVLAETCSTYVKVTVQNTVLFRQIECTLLLNSEPFLLYFLIEISLASLLTVTALIKLTYFSYFP